MEQLGIEPVLLLAQIVNFSIIAFILTKVLYRPILNALEERKKRIDEGLALAQRLREEEEKLKTKEEKLLDRARRDAKLIVEDAQKKARIEEREIVEEARKEAQSIIAKGKQEAEKEHKAMEKKIRSEAVELAILMSKRLLSQALTETDQHKVLSRHIKQLENIRV